MYMIHNSISSGDVRDILAKGILPASETGNHTWSRNSNPDLVYMSLDSFDRIGKGAAYVFGWGSYGFVLNDRWIQEHAEQFMDNADRILPDYEEALRRYGITRKNDTGMMASDRDRNCVVSTKQIPVEALDLLVASQGYHNTSLLEELPRHMGLYFWNDVWDRTTDRIIVVKEPEMQSLVRAK